MINTNNLDDEDNTTNNLQITDSSKAVVEETILKASANLTRKLNAEKINSNPFLLFNLRQAIASGVAFKNTDKKKFQLTDIYCYELITDFDFEKEGKSSLLFFSAIQPYMRGDKVEWYAENCVRQDNSIDRCFL